MHGIIFKGLGSTQNMKTKKHLLRRSESSLIELAVSFFPEIQAQARSCDFLNANVLHLL